MSKNNLLFADLSNNNNSFNAKEYAQAGHVIVALKASEGTFFVDGRHRGWALAAGMEHVAVIHYHFGRPDRSGGAEEADFFLHCTHGLRGPRDYLVYDGERAHNGAFGLDAAHCRAFDERIQEKTRYHTILYGSASTLPGAGEALAGENKRDWDADYASGPDHAAPGHVCVMRQFTDGVFGPSPRSLSGVGQCDVNLLRGGFGAAVVASSR
jgi:GH25 family lysozyme M1 (1,4-beta-N-acetylmuramidase)